MKKTLAILGCSFLLAAACATGPAEPAAGDPGLSRDDRRALEIGTGEFVAAVNAADWVKAASIFADNGVMMPPNTPMLVGRPAILGFFENYPPVGEFVITVKTIDGTGDLAYVHGMYSMTLSLEGMEPFTDSGKFLEVRRRQPDGVWRITHDIFNSDLPALAH